MSDCLLQRNKQDVEVFNSAVKGYLTDQERKDARLAKYAKDLWVQKKGREVLGVWL